MLVTQDPKAAGQSVLVQLTSSLHLPQPAQVSGEIASPKLRDPGDANAGGDLGKRSARQVVVLATCRYPARHLTVL
jgi:hypothetical protein